jgi:hypothetical protein
MDFLEKVRLGTVNLDPGKDTALSSYTAPEKKQEISERLARLSGDLGKGTLEPGQVKVDEDLAGVLVRNTGGFDPSRMRVIAIALVKAKGGWVAAPAPASFDNTGIGFDTKIRQRISALENWMLRNQATDLENIREQSVQKMKHDIQRSLDLKVLRSDSPAEVRDRFLAACAKRDLPAMLGFLGGLKEQYPPDWAERLRSADAAVSAGRRVTWPWRLLMAPEVVRVPVSDGGEQNEGLFSYACLDPAGQSARPSLPKVEILHLDFIKDDDGLWQVNLPPRFLLGPGEKEDESEDDFDQQLLDAFPEGVRKETAENPATGIEQAAASLHQALRDRTLKPLFQLMNLSGDAGAASAGCARAAQSWWALHNPDAPRLAVPLGFYETGKVGIAAFQFFSPREPERLDVRTFYFEKSKAGWLLMSGLRPRNSPSDAEIAARDWAEDRAITWRNNWREQLLSQTRQLDSIAVGNAPSEEEARKLVESWLEAVREGNIEAALRMAVWMNHQAGAARVLQNLGYEIGAAVRDEGKVSVTYTGRGETWTAVGVKSQSRDAVAFPLYLVVATPAGPRILVETDLFANASSGRELLNKEALRRVEEFSAPAAAAELVKLFERFRTDTGKQ